MCDCMRSSELRCHCILIDSSCGVPKYLWAQHKERSLLFQTTDAHVIFTFCCSHCAVMFLLLFRIHYFTQVSEKLPNLVGAEDFETRPKPCRPPCLSCFIMMRTSRLVSGFPRADRMNNISLLRVAERRTWRKEREWESVRLGRGHRESAQSGPKLRFLDYAPIHTVDNSSFAYFICHLSGIVGEGPCNSGFVNMAHPSCTSVFPSFPFSLTFSLV